MHDSEAGVAFLSIIVLASVIGGLVCAAVLLERIRMCLVVSALLALAGVLTIYSTQGAPPLSALIGITLGSVLAACLIALLLSWFFRFWTFYIKAPEIRSFLRSELIPHAWGHPGAPRLPAKALVTRWFVTIAASTGSVVGALMIKGEFWTSAFKAIDIKHIFFTLLITVVSVTLIGPLEEYVFGQRLSRSREDSSHGEGSSGNLVSDVWENFSWRAAGRLGLVALFSFQPTILHASLDEAISSGDADTIVTIIFAAIAPAFTTYYWCAALQRGERSVARRSGRAATLFSAMLCWPTVLVFCVSAALIVAAKLPGHRDVFGNSAIIFAFVLFSPLASVAVGFVFDGISAFIGGWIIEYTRRTPGLGSWHALLLMGLSFSAVTILINMITNVGLGLELGKNPGNWRQWLDGPLGAFGWMAGLAVSGFPKILTIASPNNSSP